LRKCGHRLRGVTGVGVVWRHFVAQASGVSLCSVIGEPGLSIEMPCLVLLDGIRPIYGRIHCGVFAPRRVDGPRQGDKALRVWSLGLARHGDKTLAGLLGLVRHGG
jgi:hypothetical protein